MSLAQKLVVDVKEAVKARDHRRASTLRLLLAAVRNEELARGNAPLPDEAVLRLVEREVKKHREAADAFKRGGRSAQAEAERAEGALLEVYRPAPATDAEVESLIREVASARSSAASPGDILGPVMAKLRGRVDGARVRVLVERILQERRP